MNSKQIREMQLHLSGLRRVFCTNCGMNKWIVASEHLNGYTLDVTSRCYDKRDYRV